MDEIKEKFEGIKKEGSEIKKEVRGKTLGYILAALGLVAGLAWSDAVKAFIEYIFPVSGSTLIAKLVYAVFITILVVVASVYMTRLFSKRK